MFASATTALLESKFPQLPLLMMAPSFRHDYDDLLAMVTDPCPIAVIDDNDTSAALGDAICRALKSRHDITRIALGKAPAADDKTIQLIRRKSKSAKLLVAVGSGTISDLCKYAAHLDEKPYIVFPTAASMNGYLSANASITVEGYKTTLPATLPKAIFCDLGVITTAPPRLTKSGLGDSLARPTAQADWLLSHLLLATPYDETPFSFTESLEPACFDNARGLALSDPNSVQQLMQLLLLSGLAMTHAGGSYPASQSEHMIAHTFEMLTHDAPATLHGEQIGVTAIASAARQESLLLRTPTLLPADFPTDELTTLFGKKITQAAQESYRLKQDRLEQASITHAALKTRWPDIAHAMQKVMLPSAKITEILTQAQAPRHHESLGWPTTSYAQSHKYARYLRDRFTCLDLNPN